MRGACLLLLLSCAPLAAQNAIEQALTITITALTPSVKAGSDVRVIVKMTNHTTGSLDESEIVSGTTSADPNLVFDVRDTSGNPIRKKMYEHSKRVVEQEVHRSIFSGATLTHEQNLSSLYDVSQPGTYVVQVFHSPPPGPTSEVIKSNKLLIEVKAPTLKSRELSQSGTPNVRCRLADDVA